VISVVKADKEILTKAA